MKLYISIPISGRPLDEAKCHAERIKAKFEKRGHECITPFDVCSEPGKPYPHYMGRDIEALLADDVDGVVFGQEIIIHASLCSSALHCSGDKRSMTRKAATASLARLS